VYGNGNPNTCSEGWSSSFYYVPVELSKSDISHINGQSVRSERNPHFRYNNLTLIRSQIMLHFLCANVVVVKCQAEGCEFCVLCFSFFFRGELRNAKFGQTKWNSNGCINALSALLPTLLVYTPYSILKKQTGLHSSCWWLDGWMVGCCSSNQKSLANDEASAGLAKCQMSEFDMRVTYQWQLLH